MKLNKEKLKKIIEESLDEIEKKAAPAVNPQAATQPIDKQTLVKQQRKVRGAKLAADASGLAPQEVNVQEILNKIRDTIALKGNQANAQAIKYLQLALQQVQRGTKE